MTHLPSFKVLYENHADMVFNLCLNYLQNNSDAEEVTQDVFLKVYKRLDSFKGEANIKTWIYRIAINQCLDFLKARKRKKRFGITLPISLGGQTEVYPPPSDFQHPGVLLEDQEAVASILAKINELPYNQKTVIILKAIEGLPQKEIASIMKLSVKAVESLLSRARNNLKKKMNTSEGSKQI